MDTITDLETTSIEVSSEQDYRLLCFSLNSAWSDLTNIIAEASKSGSPSDADTAVINEATNFLAMIQSGISALPEAVSDEYFLVSTDESGEKTYSQRYSGTTGSDTSGLHFLVAMSDTTNSDDETEDSAPASDLH